MRKNLIRKANSEGAKGETGGEKGVSLPEKAGELLVSNARDPIFELHLLCLLEWHFSPVPPEC